MARELLLRGAPMMTMTVAVAMQPYIDVNILSRLGSREVLGWYGAATTFSNTLVAPAFILASATKRYRLLVSDWFVGMLAVT